MQVSYSLTVPPISTGKQRFCTCPTRGRHIALSPVSVNLRISWQQRLSAAKCHSDIRSGLTTWCSKCWFRFSRFSIWKAKYSPWSWLQEASLVCNPTCFVSLIRFSKGMPKEHKHDSGEGDFFNNSNDKSHSNKNSHNNNSKNSRKKKKNNNNNNNVYLFHPGQEAVAVVHLGGGGAVPSPPTPSSFRLSKCIVHAATPQ